MFKSILAVVLSKTLRIFLSTFSRGIHLQIINVKLSKQVSNVFFSKTQLVIKVIQINTIIMVYRQWVEKIIFKTKDYDPIQIQNKHKVIRKKEVWIPSQIPINFCLVKEIEIMLC